MNDQITLALLKACGIDPTGCHSVHYSHRVGSPPTIEVGYTVAENRGTTTRIVEYELADVQARTTETWRREWVTE